ncbi:bifunctional diaminohydroxyphosphoribosylaminopyrimidine deaminase/5-amino-6-(5-phosphoribosylamino)uracil reductase RibD [soil metagenome]
MLEPRPTMKTPTLGEAMTPAEAMKWALILARRGAGFVSPNPMVGCVIVDREHKFVTGGWHQKIGEAHAEVDAIDRFSLVRGAKENIAGCHFYVTLEPCSHEGRTGSCARALAALKPASVTYAVMDPNPMVSGQGGKILNEAGVSAVCLADARAWPAMPEKPIESGVQIDLVEEAEDLIEIFLWSMRNQGTDAKPFVTVKIASSLDGRVAMHTGESQWITGEQAREKGHRLRLEHDAVIVGRKTVETDNPSLNVRLDDATGHVNSVIVVDPKGKIIERLMDFNIAKVRPPERILVCVQKGLVSEKAVERGKELGFKVFEVGGSKEGVVDLPELLVKVRALGITGVYIEGGAGTVAPFLDADLVNRLHIFMATSILGGKYATGWSDLCGVKTLAEIWKLQRQRVKLIGPDLHITGRLDLT